MCHQRPSGKLPSKPRSKIDADAVEMDVKPSNRVVLLNCRSRPPMPRTHTLPVVEKLTKTFDRLLVAQAMQYEPLVLLTADPKVSAYGGLIRLV